MPLAGFLGLALLALAGCGDPSDVDQRYYDSHDFVGQPVSALKADLAKRGFQKGTTPFKPSAVQ